MTERAPAREASSPRALEREYLDCLLAPDGRRAREVVEAALMAGTSASTLYLEVLAPAMHEIGRLWENAEVSIAQEHLATQITQTVIAALAFRLPAGDPVGAGRVAVVSSSPGELHALGGRMVADFLEAQGWKVLALGADIPARELVHVADQRNAELVALSTALPWHLPSVTRICELLGQLSRPPFIVVGGRAYDGDPGRARAIGADAFADDPAVLLELLGQRFSQHAPSELASPAP